MGSKGNKRHLKRVASPAHLLIVRKDRSRGKFFLKPIPGPHPKDFCLPLGHIIRDLFQFTKTGRETKYILNKNSVLIDGIARKDLHFPIGLMDVIEIPEINKAYRVLPSKKGSLLLSEITKEEAKYKLCKIENISTVPGGHLQLNLHDGRNILLKVDNPQKKPELVYTTGGTLKISLPTQEILNFFPLKENSQAIIYQGRNMGAFGNISKISKKYGVNASLANIQTKVGEISTSFNYLFVIGDKEPEIDLPMED